MQRDCLCDHPLFAATVERHLTPAMSQKTLLIGETYASERIFAVSIEAVAWGIQPGMPLRQALNLYPQAHTVPGTIPNFSSPVGANDASSMVRFLVLSRRD